MDCFESSPAIIRRTGWIAVFWLCFVFGPVVAFLAAGLIYKLLVTGLFPAVSGGIFFGAFWGWYWFHAVRKDNQELLKKIGPHKVLRGREEETSDKTASL